MFVDSELTPDPLNEDWVLGWGVVRSNPWHLAGIFSTKEKADSEAAKLDTSYEVHHGSHRLDSDDFVWGKKD